MFEIICGKWKSRWNQISLAKPELYATGFFVAFLGGLGCLGGLDHFGLFAQIA